MIAQEKGNGNNGRNHEVGKKLVRGFGAFANACDRRNNKTQNCRQTHSQGVCRCTCEDIVFRNYSNREVAGYARDAQRNRYNKRCTIRLFANRLRQKRGEHKSLNRLVFELIYRAARNGQQRHEHVRYGRGQNLGHDHCCEHY